MAVLIYFNPPHDSGRHDPLIHHCAGAMAMDAMKPILCPHVARQAWGRDAGRCDGVRHDGLAIP